MASYTELFALRTNDDLRNRVAVATVKAAQGLLDATPTTADAVFAARVFQNPTAFADRVLWSVLAANSSLTVVQIEGASDAAIQSAVNAVVPNLVVALANGG